ncbi:DUF5709 domain-containing protein [Sphaerisporangium fuscum]|uniref:DUF5709 domain-containing protein n=1 Tax=Sphaerisporangium fuscum TaxID=2835868 RepID=UPI001BDD6BBF|nr:DUF5709 domain-containing protein [Sphaerisporangium fuscum]
MTERDPYSRFEDEGIPDLQDGTPQQQWAEDPQEMPLPADHPTAVDDFGTTIDEEIQGESLESRVRREVPEEQPVFGDDEVTRTADESGVTSTGEEDESASGMETGLGVGADLDTRYQPDDDGAAVPEWATHPGESAEHLWEEPRPAGRLVEPDEGAREDTEPDVIAREVGPDMGGFSAEEAAMRVEPE